MQLNSQLCLGLGGADARVCGVETRLDALGSCMLTLAPVRPCPAQLEVVKRFFSILLFGKEECVGLLLFRETWLVWQFSCAQEGPARSVKKMSPIR